MEHLNLSHPRRQAASWRAEAQEVTDEAQRYLQILLVHNSPLLRNNSLHRTPAFYGRQAECSLAFPYNMTGHEVTPAMRIEDLSKYTLDELVTIARERGLINGFARKDGNGLEIRVDGTETILDHQEAIYFMRAVLQTWIIETGSLPPQTQRDGRA